MNRIKGLNRYQKSILVIQFLMLVAFTIAYFVVSSRVGYAYKGAILVPKKESGSVTYIGRVYGKDTAISVAADKTVTFRYEDKIYGPYIARKDPTAIPDDTELSQNMIGVEILQGEDIFFRGGFLKTGIEDRELLVLNEDGDINGITITYAGEDGIERDVDGNPIDKCAPSVYEILELMDDPVLTNKGSWELWFVGFFTSALTAVLMLFADELFRWNLRIQIRNADSVEPSDWEMSARYIVWTVLPIIALIAYILGLTT